jgi:hypothetical protein
MKRFPGRRSPQHAKNVDSTIPYPRRTFRSKRARPICVVGSNSRRVLSSSELKSSTACVGRCDMAHGCARLNSTRAALCIALLVNMDHIARSDDRGIAEKCRATRWWGCAPLIRSTCTEIGRRLSPMCTVSMHYLEDVRSKWHYSAVPIYRPILLQLTREIAVPVYWSVTVAWSSLSRFRILSQNQRSRYSAFPIYGSICFHLLWRHGVSEY